MQTGRGIFGSETWLRCVGRANYEYLPCVLVFCAAPFNMFNSVDTCSPRMEILLRSVEFPSAAFPYITRNPPPLTAHSPAGTSERAHGRAPPTPALDTEDVGLHEGRARLLKQQGSLLLPLYDSGSSSLGPEAFKCRRHRFLFIFSACSLSLCHACRRFLCQ